MRLEYTSYAVKCGTANICAKQIVFPCRHLVAVHVSNIMMLYSSGRIVRLHLLTLIGCNCRKSGSWYGLGLGTRTTSETPDGQNRSIAVTRRNSPHFKLASDNCSWHQPPQIDLHCTHIETKKSEFDCVQVCAVGSHRRLLPDYLTWRG